MHFATLVVLAVIASTVPSLAAPAPYTRNRSNFKRGTTTTNASDIATVQNGTISADLDSDLIRLLTDVVPEIEKLLTTNATIATSTMASKRATVDILQEIEALFGSFLKRDVTRVPTFTLPETANNPDVGSMNLNLTKLREEFSGIEVGGPIFTIPNGDGIGITGAKRDDALDRRITFPKFTGSEVSSLTSWLKNIGNVVSIGAGGAAIVGAVDGSVGSNSTKREIEQTYNEIDLAALLDGAAPQFNDRRTTEDIPKVSTSEVSALESGLSKLATVFSLGGTAASLASAFEGSNNSTRRALGLDPTDSFPLSADENPSIASSILKEIASIVGGTTGGSGSASFSQAMKRSTSNDSDIAFNFDPFGLPGLNQSFIPIEHFGPTEVDPPISIPGPDGPIPLIWG